MDRNILLTYKHKDGYCTFEWLETIEELDGFIKNNNNIMQTMECIDCTNAKEIDLHEVWTSMSGVLVKDRINDFIKDHLDLIPNKEYEITSETYNWDKGERFWCCSTDGSRKFLFYFEKDKIVGVHDRSNGLNNKVY